MTSGGGTAAVTATPTVLGNDEATPDGCSSRRAMTRSAARTKGGCAANNTYTMKKRMKTDLNSDDDMDEEERRILEEEEEEMIIEHDEELDEAEAKADENAMIEERRMLTVALVKSVVETSGRKGSSDRTKQTGAAISNRKKRVPHAPRTHDSASQNATIQPAVSSSSATARPPKKNEGASTTSAPPCRKKVTNTPKTTERKVEFKGMVTRKRMRECAIAHNREVAKDETEQKKGTSQRPRHNPVHVPVKKGVNTVRPPKQAEPKVAEMKSTRSPSKSKLVKNKHSMPSMPPPSLPLVFPSHVMPPPVSLHTSTVPNPLAKKHSHVLPLPNPPRSSVTLPSVPNPMMWMEQKGPNLSTKTTSTTVARHSTPFVPTKKGNRASGPSSSVSVKIDLQPHHFVSKGDLPAHTTPGATNALGRSNVNRNATEKAKAVPLIPKSTHKIDSQPNAPDVSQEGLQGRDRFFSIDSTIMDLVAADPSAVLDHTVAPVSSCGIPPSSSPTEAPHSASAVKIEEGHSVLPESRRGGTALARDRALSFEFFSFGINADEPLPPTPTLSAEASLSDEKPGAQSEVEPRQLAKQRPRGDSIIFDPASFTDGGIHEANALRRGRRESIVMEEKDEIEIMNSPGFAPARSIPASTASSLPPPPDIHKRKHHIHPGNPVALNAKKSSVHRPVGSSHVPPPKKSSPTSAKTGTVVTRASSKAVAMSSVGDALPSSTITLTTSSGSIPQAFTDKTINMPHGSAAAAAAAATCGDFTAPTIPSCLNGTAIAHTACPMELLNKDGRIGIYLPEARKERIAKFHSKRKMRIWRKRIKYDCRKKLADSRPRIKGRFVKRSDMDDDDE